MEEIRRSPPGMYKKKPENKRDKLPVAQLVWKRRISVINNITHTIHGDERYIYLHEWLIVMVFM